MNALTLMLMMTASEMTPAQTQNLIPEIRVDVKPKRRRTWSSSGTTVVLHAIRKDRTPPPVAARNLAIVHLSIYDAVMAIQRTHQPYLSTWKRSLACRSRRPSRLRRIAALGRPLSEATRGIGRDADRLLEGGSGRPARETAARSWADSSPTHVAITPQRRIRTELANTRIRTNPDTGCRRRRAFRIRCCRNGAM